MGAGAGRERQVGRKTPSLAQVQRKTNGEKRAASGERPGFVRRLSGRCPGWCSGFVRPQFEGCQKRSAVGFAAVFDGEDHDGVNEIVEADAVVAGAETQFGRFDILEALDIAFACGEVTSHNMQNVERGSLIDSAKVSFGGVGPGDLLPHRYWPLL